VRQSLGVYPPNQYPFLPELALGVVLRADLEEEVHKLLQWLRLAGHNESYYVHEKPGLGVSIQHYGEDLLLRDCQDMIVGHGGARERLYRTMVSILDSSVPFSKACLSSFWEGISAALSWWTCAPKQSAFGALNNARWFVPSCRNSRGMSPYCRLCAAATMYTEGNGRPCSMSGASNNRPIAVNAPCCSNRWAAACLKEGWRGRGHNRFVVVGALV
jgi:hypothetical protein